MRIWAWVLQCRGLNMIHDVQHLVAALGISIAYTIEGIDSRGIGCWEVMKGVHGRLGLGHICQSLPSERTLCTTPDTRILLVKEKSRTPIGKAPHI